MGPTPSNPIAGAVTEVLSHVGSGEPQAWNSLIALVYDDLRRLAGAYMREHGPGCILQPTALVNETYLRLLRQKSVAWKNRTHFFGVAALLMRRILVDEARRRATYVRVLDRIARERLVSGQPPIDISALDEALRRLAEMDRRQAEIVELRYFAGLTIEEAAKFLGISPKTVKRDWEMARVWLHAELRADTA
jgi:RNA polymerase sigma-70 factor, ECF subfamily